MGKKGGATPASDRQALDAALIAAPLSRPAPRGQPPGPGSWPSPAVGPVPLGEPGDTADADVVTRHLTFLGTFVTRRLDAIEGRLEELAEALVLLQSSLGRFAPDVSAPAATPPPPPGGDRASSPAPSPERAVRIEAVTPVTTRRSGWLGRRRTGRS